MQNVSRTNWGTCRYVAYIKSDNALTYKNIWLKYGITHLNIWFYNPDKHGRLTTFATDKEVDRICKIATANGVKVVASLGGGIINATQQKWWNQIQTDEGRAIVIQAIVNLCDRTNIDGIDLDLEGKSIPPKYSEFILELAPHLKERSLLFSIAASRWIVSPYVNDEALATFDMINVMSYNYSGCFSKTGSDHSSLQDTKQELNFWHFTRKVDPAKLVVGIPYYARVWDYDSEGIRTACYTKTLKAMVEFYPQMLYADSFVELDLEDGGVRQISMNSIETLIQKFELATNFGGIMCWTLENDSIQEGFCYSKILMHLRDNYLLKNGISSIPYNGK